jgi:hypothetical protein
MPIIEKQTFDPFSNVKLAAKRVAYSKYYVVPQFDLSYYK